jgi:hypothetical protein
MDEGFVLDTPEQIAMMRLLALRAALRVKVQTGMDMTRGVSLVKLSKGYGFKGRTHKAALAFINDLVTSYENHAFEPEPEEDPFDINDY